MTHIIINKDFAYKQILENYTDSKFAKKYTDHFKYFIHYIFNCSFKTKTFNFDSKVQLVNAKLMYDNLGQTKSYVCGSTRLYSIFTNILEEENIILKKHKPYVKKDKVKRSKTIVTLCPDFFRYENIKLIQKKGNKTINNLDTKINNIMHKPKKTTAKFTSYEDQIEDDFDQLEEINYIDIPEEVQNHMDHIRIHFNNTTILVDQTIRYINKKYKALNADLKMKLNNAKSHKTKLLTQISIDRLETKKTRDISRVKNFNDKKNMTITESYRVYNSFTMINSEYRQFLRMYGKPLFEVDVPNSQVRMLSFITEFYTIDSNLKDIIDNDDIYQYIADKSSKLTRNDVKKRLFVDVLFARKTYDSEMVNIFRSEFPITFDSIEKNRINDETRNSFLLQRMESIMIQNVCRKCIENNIVFSTIHDSVVTNNIEDAEQIQIWMDLQFECKTKINKL